jgi:hypothetical protein
VDARSREPRGALLALLLYACAHAARGNDPARGIRFDGPGRLLVVFENAEGERELVLQGAGSARRVDIGPFGEARFARHDLLVLAQELPAQGDYGQPETQLALHDLTTGATRRFGPTGRHYDLAPSPDGTTWRSASSRRRSATPTSRSGRWTGIPRSWPPARSRSRSRAGATTATPSRSPY